MYRHLLDERNVHGGKLSLAEFKVDNNLVGWLGSLFTNVTIEALLDHISMYIYGM